MLQSYFCSPHNNIDSKMNAGTQHQFNYRKQQERRFGHRFCEGGHIYRNRARKKRL